MWLWYCLLVLASPLIPTIASSVSLKDPDKCIMTDNTPAIPARLRTAVERSQRAVKRELDKMTAALGKDPGKEGDQKQFLRDLCDFRSSIEYLMSNYDHNYAEYEELIKQLDEAGYDAEKEKHIEYLDTNDDIRLPITKLHSKIKFLEADMSDQTSVASTPGPSDQFPALTPPTIQKQPDEANSDAKDEPPQTKKPDHATFGRDSPVYTNLRASADPFYPRRTDNDFGYEWDHQESRLTRGLLDYIATLENRGRPDPQANVKLPKFELQKFNGDPSKWKPFWDKFERSVGQNPKLAGSDKLSYLQAFLGGEALKLVENLPTTNENYDVAVQTLTKTFGNPIIALEGIHAKLCDLKPVPPKSVQKLKEFFYELENLLGALKNFDGDTESQHLISMILKKLPPGLVTSMELMKGPKVEWTTTMLREMIEAQIYAREAANRRAYKQQPKTDESAGRTTGNKDQLRSTTEAFPANDHSHKQNQDGRKAGYKSGNNARGMEFKRSNQGQSKTGLTCAYCGSAHYSDQCDKVTTIDARRKILMKQRLCFICLRSGHQSNECQSEKPCFYCRRTHSHHSSICNDHKDRGTWTHRREQAHQVTDSGDQASQTVKDLSENNEHGRLGINEKTLMKTAIVNVRNPNDPTKSLKVRVFFDCGTSRSFMTVRTASKLKLVKDKHEKLWIDRFDNKDAPPFVIDAATAKVEIQTKDKGFWRISVAICDQTMENMTRKAVPHNVVSAIPKGIVLADKPLMKNERVDVDFMIGNDYYDDFIGWTRHGTRPLMNGFWLIDSELGWIISGRLPDNQNSSGLKRESAHLILANECKPDDGFGSPIDVKDDLLLKEATSKAEFEKLASQCPGTLDDLWNLETLGVKDEPNPATDDYAIEQFNKTVTKVDDRYYVTFPWKSGTEKMPTNENLALKKMKNLVARYKARNQHEVLKQYDKIIKEQLAKGIIEEVKTIATSNRVHYQAHHGVETPLKSTKLRIVYDASAHEFAGSPSLNDCMYRGQVFLENLLDLLIRFRCYKIAIVADIEKAFLQVGLQEQERDVTRFFWLKDVTKEPDKENIIVYRFQRVPFGITASPFLLGATLMHHLKGYDSPVARQIENNLYVDNVICGVESRKEAEEFYNESKLIFKSAGMNLREYGSNDTEFIESLPVKDRIEGDNVKVLGIKWTRSTDVLAVKGPTDVKPEATKASILAELFKVFDPMGFASPVTIRGKILLQEVTKKKYAWNASLPTEVCRRWQEMAADLCKISELRIPRYIGTHEGSNQRMMVFCDASKLAYATVVYLQVEISPGVYNSNIVFAKSRVCPIKEMTIPRLELMGLLIGTRAVRTVRKSLNFEGRIVIWTDSTTALQWLSSSKIQGKFVENRVREILQENGIEFRHVPTKDNPADRASRGAKFDCLDTIWLHGPTWASRDDDQWPSLDQVTVDPLDSDPAEDANQAMPGVDTAVPFSLIVDPNDFSSLQRLIRIHAWCTRFIRKVQNRSDVKARNLLPSEIKESYHQIIKWAQDCSYNEVKEALNAQRPHPLQNDLGIFLDESGLLRCSGRLQVADISNDAKNPILLPTKSKLTELIIDEAHKANLHSGISQTLSACRQAYWIPKGRQRVREVVNRCLTCKRFDGGPFTRPLMPVLPEARVTRNRPFCHIGIDYFGPLMVRGLENCQKRWVCLFTCLSTRAVHLEMVEDMSAVEYMYALKRFVSRRGKPESIVCDNATQFKAVRETEPFSDYISNNVITWKFIPQFGPWAGGVYERLIAIIKNALKKTIGKRLLTSQQLATMITEVEYIVNCRPLTYVGEDIEDIKVLHPNDLIGIPSLNIATPDVKNVDVDYYQERGTKAEIKALYAKNARILEEFWKVWSSDYLLSLRERHTWNHNDPKVRVRRAPQVGEIVLLKEPLRKRNQWDLGRITDVIPSKDGSIRAVMVALSDKKTTIRPVNLLYPIECDIEGKDKVKDGQGVVEIGVNDIDHDTNSNHTAPTATYRPKRRAAMIAANKIRDVLNKDFDPDAD